MISPCFPVQPEPSGLSTRTLLKSVFLRTYRNLYKWRDPSIDARILILKKFLCQEGCLAWRVCLPNCFRTSGCCMDVQATYEPLSKLLVSPSIDPIVVPYIIPYITPFKEFRLWLIWRACCFPGGGLHGARVP